MLSTFKMFVHIFLKNFVNKITFILLTFIVVIQIDCLKLREMSSSEI